MNLGTRSLLFGVHQFLWHPITVWLAWVQLYGFPSWRECACILIHDWGYAGCIDMDGPEGRLHPYDGAELAGRWFGPRYHALVMLHSREIARRMGVQPSRLCWADKLSMRFDPWWFYLPRAWITGELDEYLANARASGFIQPWEGARVWHYRLVTKLSELSREKTRNYVS